MKSARQKDEALLRDIAQARALQARPRIWWLGQSGFLVYVAGKTILFDPYLSDSLTRKYANTDKPHERITERVIAPELLTGIDVITCSHNHTDHLDAETLLPLSQVQSRVPAGCAEGERRVCPGAARTVDDKANPSGCGRNRASCRRRIATGFLRRTTLSNAMKRGRCRCSRVRCRRLANSGCTTAVTRCLHDRLVAALKPHQRADLAFVPINGNKPERRVAGNLNGAEAAWLSLEIGAKLAIPHHFDMFRIQHRSPGRVRRRMRPPWPAFPGARKWGRARFEMNDSLAQSL